MPRLKREEASRTGPSPGAWEVSARLGFYDFYGNCQKYQQRERSELEGEPNLC
jgi:hypothetical protein